MPFPMPPARFLVCPDPTTGGPTMAAVTSVAFPSDQYDSITVSVDNLAGSETVQLRVLVEGVPKQVTDIYGTAINLTATVSAVALEGGPQYQFIKDETATACSVIVAPKQRG